MFNCVLFLSLNAYTIGFFSSHIFVMQFCKIHENVLKLFFYFFFIKEVKKERVKKSIIKTVRKAIIINKSSIVFPQFQFLPHVLIYEHPKVISSIA